MLFLPLINFILKRHDDGDDDDDGWWCDTLLKHTTCLVAGWGLSDSLSLVSLPQLELSLISWVNFLDCLGLGGAALLWLPIPRPIPRAHTCDWMCSQTLRNLRMLPEKKKNKFSPLFFHLFSFIFLFLHHLLWNPVKISV